MKTVMRESRCDIGKRRKRTAPDLYDRAVAAFFSERLVDGFEHAPARFEGQSRLLGVAPEEITLGVNGHAGLAEAPHHRPFKARPALTNPPSTASTWPLI